MSLREFVLIGTSSELLFMYDSSIEPEIYLYCSEFCSFSTKLLSSNCTKVTMLPVCHAIMYCAECTILLVAWKMPFNTDAERMIMH